MSHLSAQTLDKVAGSVQVEADIFASTERPQVADDMRGGWPRPGRTSDNVCSKADGRAAARAPEPSGPGREEVGGFLLALVDLLGGHEDDRSCSGRGPEAPTASETAEALAWSGTSATTKASVSPKAK